MLPVRIDPKKVNVSALRKQSSRAHQHRLTIFERRIQTRQIGHCSTAEALASQAEQCRLWPNLQQAVDALGSKSLDPAPELDCAAELADPVARGGDLAWTAEHARHVRDQRDRRLPHRNPARYPLERIKDRVH